MSTSRRTRLAEGDMDRTLINLLSVLVGGAGLFTVLTGFSVPELHMSYFGQNPFAVKRDVIENVMNWTFSLVALAGLGLQVWAEIWGSNLTERSHDAKYYAIFSAVGLVVVGLLVWALTGAANMVAKRQWQPTVIALQREVFERAKFASEHDGWTPEHWESRERMSSEEADRLRADNLRSTDEQITQLTKLLEVDAQGDLRRRVATLEPLFSK